MVEAMEVGELDEHAELGGYPPGCGRAVPAAKRSYYGCIPMSAQEFFVDDVPRQGIWFTHM